LSDGGPRRRRSQELQSCDSIFLIRVLIESERSKGVLGETEVKTALRNGRKKVKAYGGMQRVIQLMLGGKIDFLPGYALGGRGKRREEGRGGGGAGEKPGGGGFPSFRGRRRRG